MANELNVAKSHAILTLHARGWSQRRIARELSMDRETVARHLKLAGAIQAKPASAENAPSGSGGGSPAKTTTSTNALTGSGGPLVIGEVIAGGASVAGGAPPEVGHRGRRLRRMQSVPAIAALSRIPTLPELPVNPGTRARSVAARLTGIGF